MGVTVSQYMPVMGIPSVLIFMSRIGCGGQFGLEERSLYSWFESQLCLSV